MKSGYFIAFLLWTVALAGQSRVQQPAPDPVPKKPGTVEGVVTNSVSKMPVKKATIVLHNARGRFSYMASTDAEGHFSFDTVEPGQYYASAARDGFVQYAAQGPMHTISVAEEEHVRLVTIELTPTGAISGKALDEDGDPIIGASIQAMRYK